MNLYLLNRPFLRKFLPISVPLLLVLAVSLFISACKESDTLGGNLLPNGDQSQFKTSSKFNLISFSVKEDSVKSDDLSLSLFGSYVDPVFGKSSASFLTQFVSSSNQLNFGLNPLIDSVVLSMNYAGYYGKIDKLYGSQKVRIYRVSKNIIKDSSYYSAQNPLKYATEADFISEHIFLPDPTGKYQTGSPMQKFNLPLSFGQNILDNQLTINTGGFINFFKGLYFKPVNNNQTSGSGSILTFNLVNSAAPSKITLYFHNSSVTQQQQFDLLINSDCSRINFFQHERNGIPAIQNQLNDTTQGKTQIFIQNMAGLSGKLWFSNIESWKDSMPMVISKAELVIPVETSLTDIYGIQTRLLLVEKGSDGQYISIPDFDLGDNYFNGNINASNNTYKFNLATYLQEIISGKRVQKGLYLVPTASAIGANRVVLKGSNYIKLNVTYTKIK
ncbi:MAG TPA: DUF4270 domain-containing protein [Bacteroidia bacterium]|nr:DUF4270 domain-containing protein [Bacteroidia bacterium]